MRGLVLAAILVAGCDDNAVNWSDLDGVWRFRAEEGTALEVFQKAPFGTPGLAADPGGPGFQLLFREPPDSAPVEPLATFPFRLDAEHGSLNYVLSFGANPVSAKIQRVSDDQMITRLRPIGRASVRASV